MDPNTVILDISSDEEVDPNIAFDPVVGVDKDFIGDLDWIKEFFDVDDVLEERADDSDDLVFVGEVLSNPKQKLKSSVGKPADDDDCVVLEGDPDKLVTIQNDTTSDSDDVLIVGQKGQVACRDFPHPRHLCANFPFASIPHERHCNRCHCYVCESPAPCLKWGTGISSIDHCHANEKDEFWRVQKKSFRNSNKSPPPVSGVNSTSPAVGVKQMNPNYSVPPLFSFKNPVAQSKAGRPTPIHQGAASTNFSMLSTVNPGRTQESGYVVPRHQFQSRSISQQLLSTSNRKIPRNRINNVSNLGAQFNSPRAVFKRTGSVGLGSTTTHCAYSANNYGSQHSGNAPSGVTPDDGNSIRYEVLCSLVETPSTTQWGSSKPMNDGIATTFVPSLQNMRSEPASSMFSQPQASSMCSQPQASSMCSQPQLSSEPQLSLQSNMGNLENWVPSLPQESFQSCVVLPLPPESVQSYGVSPPTQNSSQWYTVPSPHKESSRPYVGSMFVNSPSPQHPASSCSNVGSIPASSVPCQPPVRSQSSHPLSNFNQNIFQLGIQTPRWATTTARQSNQQPPVEMSQLQSAEPTGENPFLGDCDTQYNGDIGSSSLYFEIENWLWDNQPVTGGAETSLHSGLMLSPEPALPIDAGPV